MTYQDTSYQDQHNQQQQQQQQQTLLQNTPSNPQQSLRDPSGTSNNPYSNLNNSQHPPSIPVPQNPQRVSNNPFIPYDSSDFSSFLPQSIPQPQSPQSRYSSASIRPLSVPVNDAFDYSSYNLSESTPTASQYPLDIPLLASDSHSRWNTAPMSFMNTPQPPQPNQKPAAGPQNPSSYIQSPPFSSSSSDNQLHSKTSTLSPISPIENEQRYLKPNSPPSRNPSTNHPNPPQIVVNASIPEVDPNKFKIDTTEEEMKLDDQEISLNSMVMKRHRVATQRFPEGRTKPKRSKSKFSKHHHSKGSSNKPSLPSESYSIIGGSEQAQEANHRVYFNMPLPDDFIDPETELPINIYPRNKVRTTKYTPLSFLPKNMYSQFSNVANIYFLFIVILGVSIIYTRFFFFFFTNILNFRHFLFLVYLRLFWQRSQLSLLSSSLELRTLSRTTAELYSI